MIKKSSIPDAGLGVFAKRPFKKDEVIGMYGGEPNATKASIYALQNHENIRFVPRSTQMYMGMHYLNSSWKNEDISSNVIVDDDLIFTATKDIDIDEELLWNYKYGPPWDDESSDKIGHYHQGCKEPEPE